MRTGTGCKKTSVFYQFHGTQINFPVSFYCILNRISLRGLYAGGIILLLTAPIETGLIFNGWSFLVMFLNGAVFSAIGVVVSFLAKNHADVPRFSNYIIMPMAYLCNTFFSTEKLPGFVGKFVSALPLSHQPSDEKHFIR